MTDMRPDEPYQIVPGKYMYYGLDGQPISLNEWTELYRSGERFIARTDLPGGVWVSTVLLGIDHSFRSEGPPIIFETMAFTSHEDMTDLDCERYATREQAEIGHDTMVTRWTGWTPGDPHPESAEPSFMTQFIQALGTVFENRPPELGEPGPDSMRVMYPKGTDIGAKPLPE